MINKIKQFLLDEVLFVIAIGAVCFLMYKSQQQHSMELQKIYNRVGERHCIIHCTPYMDEHHRDDGGPWFATKEGSKVK